MNTENANWTSESRNAAVPALASVAAATELHPHRAPAAQRQPQLGFVPIYTPDLWLERKPIRTRPIAVYFGKDASFEVVLKTANRRQ